VAAGCVFARPDRHVPAAAVPQEVVAKSVPLVIVGEGGHSGYLFQYAADTYVREHGGVRYTVHDGDEFVSAMQDFVRVHGPISKFVYLGHGNEVGLYVNQAPHINGALYVNDPALNEPFRAASIYDLPPSLFASGSTALFYGCNVARSFEGQDSFAEQFANHFRTKVSASLGPTEFSFDPKGKSFVKGPVAAIFQPVYMVPTASDKGFIDVLPSSATGGYIDVHASMAAAAAIENLHARGLALEKGTLFRPYQSITAADARAFCLLVNRHGECGIEGAADSDRVRNTAALKMLLDAAGFPQKKSSIPYAAQISFANAHGLLTPDFTRRRWYSRSEMAMLTRNILALQEGTH
jgi:hypothetical protein